MGSLAKRFGQLSRKSLESESANILRTIKANKVPGSLSLQLDGTLKRGHDMKAFGLGTMASMATLERYKKFTVSMNHVYSTMEEELDQSALPLWNEHGSILRRSDALRQDLLDVMSEDEFERARQNPSPATRDYVGAIRQAGQSDRSNADGARLIGHLYCRYFADLFGGQVLATPYLIALQLPQSPRHYHFNITDRRTFIEKLYQDINQAGESLTTEQQDKSLYKVKTTN